MEKSLNWPYMAVTDRDVQMVRKISNIQRFVRSNQASKFNQ